MTQPEALLAEFRLGISRADKNLAEGLAEIRAHEVALKAEEQMVGKLFVEFVEQLTLGEINKLDIYPNRPSGFQLLFCHHGQPNEIETNPRVTTFEEADESSNRRQTLASVASIAFEPSAQCFHYSDFLSNFQRRLPLPPNRASLGLAAKYLGQSIRSWSFSEVEQDALRSVAAGLRVTLKSIDAP